MQRYDAIAGAINVALPAAEHSIRLPPPEAALARALVEPPVVLTHRPGAGHAVAATVLAKHAGDGHLLKTTTSTPLTTHILGLDRYNDTDFAPVAMLSPEYPSRAKVVVFRPTPEATSALNSTWIANPIQSAPSRSVVSARSLRAEARAGGLQDIMEMASSRPPEGG